MISWRQTFLLRTGSPIITKWVSPFSLTYMSLFSPAVNFGRSVLPALDCHKPFFLLSLLWCRLGLTHWLGVLRKRMRICIFIELIQGSLPLNHECEVKLSSTGNGQRFFSLKHLKHLSTEQCHHLRKRFCPPCESQIVLEKHSTTCIPTLHCISVRPSVISAWSERQVVSC